VLLRLAMTHTHTGTRPVVFSRELQCVVASQVDVLLEGEGGGVRRRM